MDSNSDANANAHAGPSRPQSQHSLRTPSERNRAFMPSTLSPVMPGPATPAESDAPADEYFGPLASSVSRRSRLSTASHGRPGSVSASDTHHSERPRRPSIRIRRSSAGLTGPPTPHALDGAPQQQHDTISSRHDGLFHGNRPRSASQPGPAPPAAADAGAGRPRNSWRVPQLALPRLTEEGARPTMAELGMEGTPPLSASASMPTANPLERSRTEGEADVEYADGKKHRQSIVGRLFRPSFRRASVGPPPEAVDPRVEDEYNEELVDWLDIIDPEVQTLSTLTNVQNSLFVPDLGSWVNRRPTYVLSQPAAHTSRPVPGREPIPPPAEPTIREEEEEGPPRSGEEDEEGLTPHLRRSDTITSRLTDSHYAALPHGRRLEGWTAAEKWELDDHVRHMLHSRRSKFKRQMKGFGQYVRRPLGFLVTLYATLITLFGLAWVLFLIGWIYVGDNQVYAVHIIDSVLVALFAVVGDGLAPFRAVDTYHLIFIWRYSHIVAKARKKAARELAQSEAETESSTANTTTSQEKQPAPAPAPALAPQEQPQQPPSPPVATEPFPPLPENTGIPVITLDGDNNPEVDLEDAKSDTFSSVDFDYYLTPKQRKSMEHHQNKLSKSHSFYKPHETFTHHAFPLGHLIAVIILLDCHSCLQISLGATTWGIDYHHRPFAITTVILCVSITCNLTAGLVIMFGDKKTRKKDVVDLLERQALTGDAIKKVERRRGKERDSKEDSDEKGKEKE